MADTTLKRPAPKPDAGKQGSRSYGGFLGSLLTTLVTVAIIVGLAGIGLNRGFGVHVPFLGAYFVLFAGLMVVKFSASLVAETWHTTRVKADVAFVTGIALAQQAAQAQSGGGIEALLEAVTKVDGNGGSPYL